MSFYYLAALVVVAGVTAFAVYRRRSVKLAMKFLGFSMELEARDRET